MAQNQLYDQLLQGYLDDTEKYVKGRKTTNVVRMVLERGWQYAGETIALGNIQIGNMEQIVRKMANG